jgi:3-deoxy-D-arabino-heptulosonate 7-phosphate (DAHP) synthase
VHNRPEQALCDGKQSITLEAFAAMVKGVRDVAEAVGRTL